MVAWIRAGPFVGYVWRKNNGPGLLVTGNRTGAKHGENSKILPVCSFIISRQAGNMKGAEN